MVKDEIEYEREIFVGGKKESVVKIGHDGRSIAPAVVSKTLLTCTEARAGSECFIEWFEKKGEDKARKERRDWIALWEAFFL